MADPTKPTLDHVKSRVEALRQELIRRAGAQPDSNNSLKELLIGAGYTNMRLAAHNDPLTLAELVDDLLLTIE